LHVVFVSHYALPHLGGIEVVVDALSRSLVARGHSVTHLAAGKTSETDDAPQRTLRIRAWNALEDRYGIPYPVFAPRALWRTATDVIASADVVHVHGMVYENCALAMAIARRRRIPARVLTEHVGFTAVRRLNEGSKARRRSGSWIKSRLVDVAEFAAIYTTGRYTARAAETIITLNSTVSAQMRAFAPRSTVLEIDNGVDAVRYRPPRAGERERLRAELGWDEKPRVLFVGRLVEKKRAPVAIEAARLAGGAFELVIVGPGTVDGTPPHVRFLGGQPPERVAEIYRAADLFLLPSRGEGFPLTAQEAMASGLPIILGDDPAFHSILAGAGDAARLVPGDPNVIVQSIAELLAKPGARDEAARYARSRFSWNTTAERHLAVYEELRARRIRS
jgi:D-inositol-3-phosphate glycosyltransferase